MKYNKLKETDFNTNSTQVSAKKELANEVLYLIYDYSLSVTDNMTWITSTNIMLLVAVLHEVRHGNDADGELNSKTICLRKSWMILID